jgi:hypothetical protein
MNIKFESAWAEGHFQRVVTEGETFGPQAVSTVRCQPRLVHENRLSSFGCPDITNPRRSLRRPIWVLLLSVVLGMLCFPGIALCQTPIACGQTVTNTTTQNNQIDQFAFIGSNGQIVSVALWVSALDFEADVFNPAGQLQVSISTDTATNLTLIGSGTFIVKVHQSSYAGTASYSLSLQSVTGGGCDSQTLSCGQTLTNSTSFYSEMDAYSFSGTSGQPLSLALWAGSLGMVADIYTPAGQLQASVSTDTATNLTLANTGIFTVLVHAPAIDVISSYSLSLQSVTGGGCDSQRLSCGQTLTNSTSFYSEMDAYSFSGTSGEELSLAMWAGALGMVADIYTPAGQLLASVSTDTATNLTLTNTGTFTILVHQSSYAGTASYSLSLQSVIGGGCDSQPLSCGETLSKSTSFRSEMDAYSFSGTSGQELSLAMWAGALGMVADIYTPAGQLLASVSTDTATNLTLTNTGTFTILVHQSSYAGTTSYSLSLQSVIGGGCDSQPLSCGETLSKSTSFYSEMDGYAFAANAGENVSLSTSGFGAAEFDVYDPTGSNITRVGPSTVTNLTLALTGYYTLLVHADNYASIGTYGLTMTCINQTSVSISATTPNASDFGPIPGVFTVTRSGPTNGAQTVYYSISGTASNGVDYVFLTSPVIIPAAAYSSTVTATPILYSTPNSSSTVTLTLATNPFYELGSPGTANLVITQITSPIINVSNRMVTLGSVLQITNIVSDAYISSSQFAFTNISSPSGVTLNPVTGVLTWTPTTISTNTIFIGAHDTNAPGYGTTNNFTVIVIETNARPVLPVIPTQTIRVLTSLTVTNTATDADIHATVGYNLLNPPEGLAIGSNGIITWTPSQAQSPSTNTIATVATGTDINDQVNPHLSVTNYFQVVVTNAGTGPVPIAIYSTGLDANSNPLPRGSADPRYTIISAPSPDSPGSAFVTLQTGWPGGSPGGWVSDTSSAQWLSPHADQSGDSGYVEPVGLFDYRLTFNLVDAFGNALDPKTAIISGDWAVDDTGTMYLNGQQVATTPGFSSLTPFSVGTNFIAGTNTLDLVVDNTPGGGTFANPSGLILQISGTAMPVIGLPTITIPPASLTRIVGSSANFDVTVGGSVPLSYQWYFGNNAVSNAIPTATNYTYAIPSVQAANSGFYTVVVTNAYGRTNATAKLTVISPPSSVVISPANQTVFEGSTVAFSVASTGTPPFTYQWACNSTNISGATNSTLTLTDVQPSSIGNYSVMVENPAGVATNLNNAALSVLIFTATHSSPAYESPGRCVVSCQVSWALDQSLVSLTLEPVLPSGWTLLSANGSGNPEIENGKIAFNEGSAPNPLTFNYTASVPGGQSGTQSIQDTAFYFLSNMTQPGLIQATPNPLVVRPGSYISAPIVHDSQISFAFYGDTGSNYILQASPDLVHWTNLNTIVPTNGFFQTNLPLSGGKMFYRTMLGQ